MPECPGAVNTMWGERGETDSVEEDAKQKADPSFSGFRPLLLGAISIIK